jgi:hypothetical protein
MKTLIAALLASASFSVAAQGRILEFQAACVSIDGLADVLEEFDEMPSLTMTSSREINGKLVEYATVLFINYETKTWTLAERVTKDRYCVTATGDNIKPHVAK